MDQLNGPLFYTIYGRIRYCHYSGEFKIDFGDMSLWLCHEQLSQLTRRVNQLTRAIGPQYLSVTRQVAITPPGCEGEQFRFYVDELLDLQTLLNGARVMIDLYQFLDDHQFTLETGS